MNVLQPEGGVGLRPAAAVLHAVDPTADTAAAADGTAAGSDVVVFHHLQPGSIAAAEAAVEVDTHCSAVVEGIARGNRPAAVAAAAVVLDCLTCPSRKWPREPLRSMRTPCWAVKQASELDPMARCETEYSTFDRYYGNNNLADQIRVKVLYSICLRQNSQQPTNGVAR